MGLDYFIFYAEASIICIVILLMIFINDRLNSTQQEKQVWFNRAIVAFIAYFLSDLGWAAVLAGILPPVRSLVELFNLTNYVLLSVMAYEWFMFMAASERMPFRHSRAKRVLFLLPMFVSTALMVVFYAADPYYWISESGELNGLYYPMMIAVPAFFLITAFVFSVINASKAQTREDRWLFRLIGIFPLGVMGFGMLQVVTLSAPSFCFGCTIMLLFFYIQNMQTLISVDDLTRLNNRGQINRYMEQVRYRENVQTYVMMIDIDRFKEVNDTYGHAEGDRALMLVSDALKQACDGIKVPAFLGRYGGDEFTIILQKPEDAPDGPERAAENIRAEIAKKQRENDLPYPLAVSIGYDLLRDKNDTMQACMVRADEMLYKEKRAKGAGR